MSILCLRSYRLIRMVVLLKQPIKFYPFTSASSLHGKRAYWLPRLLQIISRSQTSRQQHASCVRVPEYSCSLPSIDIYVQTLVFHFAVYVFSTKLPFYSGNGGFRIHFLRHHCLRPHVVFILLMLKVKVVSC